MLLEVASLLFRRSDVEDRAWKVAKVVSYPQSSDVQAMVAISYFLVPRGRMTT
jgi:hypothetical protein